MRISDTYSISINIFPFQKKIKIKNEVNGNFQINKKTRIFSEILVFLY
jgi:hypothetical protein